MNKNGQPSTKAELIAAYGEEWYANFVEKCKQANRKRYHENPEKERERRRQKYRNNAEYAKAYNKKHREVYRINMRDRQRLLIMGLDLDGKEVHHFVYHSDNNDKTWLDDIAIMTRDEYRAWHFEHPEFTAMEHIVL